MFCVVSACSVSGIGGNTLRPCLLNGFYRCVPDIDMDCITDSQVMVIRFEGCFPQVFFTLIIIVPCALYTATIAGAHA